MHPPGADGHATIQIWSLPSGCEATRRSRTDTGTLGADNASTAGLWLPPARRHLLQSGKRAAARSSTRGRLHSPDLGLPCSHNPRRPPCTFGGDTQLHPTCAPSHTTPNSSADSRAQLTAAVRRPAAPHLAWRPTGWQVRPARVATQGPAH